VEAESTNVLQNENLKRLSKRSPIDEHGSCSEHHGGQC